MQFRAFLLPLLQGLEFLPLWDIDDTWDLSCRLIINRLVLGPHVLLNIADWCWIPIGIIRCDITLDDLVLVLSAPM